MDENSRSCTPTQSDPFPTQAHELPVTDLPRLDCLARGASRRESFSMSHAEHSDNKHCPSASDTPSVAVHNNPEDNSTPANVSGTLDRSSGVTSSAFTPMRWPAFAVAPATASFVTAYGATNYMSFCHHIPPTLESHSEGKKASTALCMLFPSQQLC